MHRPKLKIDPEFRGLIRPLTTSEREQLEANLLADGCLDAIITWKGIIVDGHNRYEICTEHDIPFNIIEKEFDCRESVIAWICNHQLGRRNLSEATRKYLIGIQYDAEKISRRLRNKMGLNQYGHLDPEIEAEIERGEHKRHLTAERIAKENNISPATVQKYSLYSKALDRLKQKVPEIVPKILSGEYKISHENVIELADLSPQEIRIVMRNIEAKEEASNRYKVPRTALQELPRRKEPHKTMGATIKDMPAFDPDAELVGLALTIPSWVSSLDRLQQKTELGVVSPKAKLRLIRELAALDSKAMELSRFLGGGPHG